MIVGRAPSVNSLADRALQVAEVLERHGRRGVAEDVAALRDPVHGGVDHGDRFFCWACRLVGARFAASAAGGDQDHDDRHDHDAPTTIAELRQAPAACRAGRLGLLERFALGARLLAALLAGQVLLVVVRGAQGANFYRFLFNGA